MTINDDDNSDDEDNLIDAETLEQELIKQHSSSSGHSTVLSSAHPSTGFTFTAPSPIPTSDFGTGLFCCYVWIPAASTAITAFNETTIFSKITACCKTTAFDETTAFNEASNETTAFKETTSITCCHRCLFRCCNQSTFES